MLNVMLLSAGVTTGWHLAQVVQQQFSGAQGIGHHYGGSQIATTGGQFHGDLGMGVGREPFTAVGFGDDQGEEAMLLDVRPGLRWQVHGLADFPVADHCAQLFGGAVNKCLFFFGQPGLGVGQQLVPVGAAAKQLAVPPHGAGIDGIAFGLRHRRQGLLEPVEQGGGKDFATKFGQ